MLEKIAFKVLALIAFLGSVFGIYKTVKKSGYKAAQNEHKEQKAEEKKAEAVKVIETVKEVNHVKETVSDLPVGDAAKRLRDEWSRD